MPLNFKSKLTNMTQDQLEVLDFMTQNNLRCTFISDTNVLVYSSLVGTPRKSLFIKSNGMHPLFIEFVMTYGDEGYLYRIVRR